MFDTYIYIKCFGKKKKLKKKFHATTVLFWFAALCRKELSTNLYTRCSFDLRGMGAGIYCLAHTKHSKKDVSYFRRTGRSTTRGWFVCFYNIFWINWVIKKKNDLSGLSFMIPTRVTNNILCSLPYQINFFFFYALKPPEKTYRVRAKVNSTQP